MGRNGHEPRMPLEQWSNAFVSPLRYSLLHHSTKLQARRNIGLWPVRPAECRSAEIFLQSRQRAECPLGAQTESLCSITPPLRYSITPQRSSPPSGGRADRGEDLL